MGTAAYHCFQLHDAVECETNRLEHVEEGQGQGQFQVLKSILSYPYYSRPLQLMHKSESTSKVLGALGLFGYWVIKCSPAIKHCIVYDIIVHIICLS